MKICETEVNTVLVFKNGVVVVEKNLWLPPNQDNVVIEKPDYAIHGSYWITVQPEDGQIVSLRIIDFKEPPKKKQVACSDYEDILKCNIGKKLTIVKRSLDTSGNSVLESIQGVVHSVSGPFVFLGLEGGVNSLFKIANIDRICVENSKDLALCRVEEEVKTKQRIRVRYKSRSEKPIVATLSYLLKDIIWYPFYRMFLDTSSKVASLRMQAVLVNNSETLNAKKFIFAGGNPKMESVSIPDVFVTGESGSKVRAGPGSQPQSQTFNKFMNPVMNLQQMQPARNFMVDNELGDLEAGDDDGSSSTSAKATDFVFYEKRDVLSEKDSRLVVPMFDLRKMAYEDMYLCKLVEGEQTPQVQHIIRLKNSSDYPWTMGSCIITTDKQIFASQTTSYFTPCGGISEIETEKAVSIRVTFAMTSKATTYVKKLNKSTKIKQMELTGKVSIINFQPKEVKMLIKTDFVGKIITKKSEKYSKLEEKPYQDYNANHERTFVEWEVTIKAGKTKSFTYSHTKWKRE